MSSPFFSIVIPTYNRAAFLPKVIESFLQQRVQDFELIIVDDGSTDNTEEVVAPYLSEKIYYYKKENAERAAARNFGTQKAKGKYINWFDSDDYALNNHLETALEFSANKDVFHLAYKHETPNFELLRNVDDLPSLINDCLYKGNILSCNGVFVKKEIALENPFNEIRELSASEDFELWLRLASNHTIYHQNIITSVIVNHDQRSVLSMSSADKLIERFTTFNLLIENNRGLKNYYSGKLNYLLMKNYLWLAVDLANNEHKKKSWRFLKLALKKSKSALFQRSFFATIKHLIIR
tara:strand:+ start:34541 stop:35422 length:882 start_codon:yes stop_codon:yes gene_type:complete